MKALRFIAFAFGGIAAVLAALVLFVAISFDAAKVKEELRQVVRDTKQRELNVEGDVTLSVYPNLGLKLGRTTLSERGSTRQFAAVDTAHVSIALLPLLSGKLVVDEILVDGASIALVRNVDGSLNVEDLFSHDSKDNDRVDFDLAGLRIDSAQIALRDEQAGRAVELSGLALQAGRIARQATGNIEASGVIRSAASELEQRFALGMRYSMDLDAHSFRFSEFALRTGGKLAGMSSLDSRIAFQTLDLGESGGFDLTRLQVKLDGVGAQGKTSLSVDAPAVSVGPSHARGERLGAVLRLEAGARAAEFRLSAGRLDGTAQALALSRMEVDVEARDGVGVFKGRIGSPASFIPAGVVFELPALAGAFKLTHPDMPARELTLAVTGQLSVEAEKRHAGLKVDLRPADSRVQASFDVDGGDPPKLRFDIDIDRIDLDRYRVPAADGPSSGWPDLEWLKQVDASGMLHAGALSAAGMQLSQLEIQVRAGDGRLALDPHSAQLYGGRVKGAATVTADGYRVALRERVEDVDLHPLLHDLLGKDMLDGRGTLTLNLRTEGSNAMAWKQALSGTAAVSLRNGAIRGIDIAERLRAFKRRASAQAAPPVPLVYAADGAERTDLSELSANFTVEKGVAHNDDLRAKSPFLRLEGHGDIDLPASRIDYLARVSVVATASGQGGRELAALRGVTVPVRLSGSLTEPQFSLEPGNALATAVGSGARKLKDAAEQTLDGMRNLIGP